MPRNLETQFTYARPNKHFTVGVARHNVEDLLELDPRKAAAIEAKYSQRPGHIPQVGGVEGVLLRDSSGVSDPVVSRLLARGRENTEKQIAYLGELSGESDRFTIFTPNTLKRHLDQTGGKALIAPYLNNGKFNAFMGTEGLQRDDIEVSGLHSEVVHDLKDKGKFHDLVREANDPDFAVPHHEVVKVGDVMEKAEELIAFEDELYAAIAMPNYKKGIFGRLSFSDGGYGSFNIHEKDSKIILETDDKKEHQPYDNWKDALTDAQTFMEASTGGDTNADVVLSRSLDLRDVPGLSMFFMDGEVLPLGFNGQILDEQTKACVGTTSYEPTDPYIQNRQTEFEDRVSEASKGFVHNLAKEKGIDAQELRGPMNVDVMILGQQEQEAQRRIIDGLRNGSIDSSLRAKLRRYGQLDQAADYFLAESNPRRTNLIEAIDEVLLVERMDQHVANMRAVLTKGLRTEDAFSLPMGINVDELTAELLETYSADDRENGLVILRTRPLEAPKKGELAKIGIIMTGEAAHRKGELHAIFEDIKKAA